MNKGLYLLAVLGVVAIWVGCKKSEPAADLVSTAYKLVTLEVPNMT